MGKQKKRSKKKAWSKRWVASNIAQVERIRLAILSLIKRSKRSKAVPYEGTLGLHLVEAHNHCSITVDMLRDYLEDIDYEQ